LDNTAQGIALAFVHSGSAAQAVHSPFISTMGECGSSFGIQYSLPHLSNPLINVSFQCTRDVLHLLPL
jgi:hypothetical protein